MHTSMGLFSHRKLMLTMGLQLVLVVYSNLPHAGSHWTLQTSKIPHHWCAASARMGRGGCSAQSTWVRMVSSNTTGANSISDEKRPGMIKGQNEKGEFNIIAGRRKHYRSQHFPREIRWWFLACWRIWAEVLYLLLTLSHFNPLFFFIPSISDAFSRLRLWYQAALLKTAVLLSLKISPIPIAPSAEGRNSLDKNPCGTLCARFLHWEVKIQVQCVEFASAASLLPSPPSVLWKHLLTSGCYPYRRKCNSNKVLFEISTTKGKAGACCFGRAVWWSWRKIQLLLSQRTQRLGSGRTGHTTGWWRTTKPPQGEWFATLGSIVKFVHPAPGTSHHRTRYRGTYSSNIQVLHWIQSLVT